MHRSMTVRRMSESTSWAGRPRPTEDGSRERLGLVRRLLCLSVAIAGILLRATVGHAGILDASWIAPTTNVDGSQLTDLKSYRVYYGTSLPPCPGSSFFEIASSTPNPAANQTVSFRLTGLITGTPYYVSVTAVNTNDEESACFVPTQSAVARIEPPPSLTLSYNGKLRDRVGQGNTALGADGALDGTLTATLSGGGRTITGLQLQSTGPGTWDTAGSSAIYWVLGVAATLDGALLNDPTTMAVNFPVADGGSFVIFASDLGGREFVPGATLTLTATFSDGTTATAVTMVAASSLSLTYNGELRDRVGQGDTALGPDGALDGALTATLRASGGRTITGLQLQSTGPGTWDTAGSSAIYWVLGAAATLDGALLNDPTTMAVNFPVADGGSFVIFASDLGGREFVSGATLTLTATFSDGTTATAETRCP